MEKLPAWVRENLLSVFLGGIGMVVMGVGVLQLGGAGRTTEVEIIEPEDPVKEARTVVVDVAGAVLQPGVFEMDAGVRVADALMAAGGLAVDADRDWVARFVNQAETVTDGMKIFIPVEGEHGQQQTVAVDDNGVAGQVSGAEVVNVNTASESELDALWGIGEARAQAIVENRPYGSVEELKEKAGIPANVLERNQGKLSVY